MKFKFVPAPRLLLVAAVPLAAMSANLSAQVVSPGIDGGYGYGGAVVGAPAQTAASAAARGLGELREDTAQAMLFRSLSAEKLQEAIDKQLDNRRERIETYYQMRELNDEQTEQAHREAYGTISESKAEQLAKSALPDRLTERELDPESGKIKWPSPLDAAALEPYRRPIDRGMTKRVESPEEYTAGDARMVNRMIDLIKESVEALDEALPAAEHVALDNYLDRIGFEARHTGDGKRLY